MKIGLLVGILLVLIATSSAPKTPAPEPVSTGVYNVPVWDTHAVTIVGGEPVEAAHALYLCQGEPMERSITATWPGPEFYKLTGCPTSGPDIGRPASEYLEPWELPPPPPSDEFVEQLIATPPPPPPLEPAQTGVHTVTAVIHEATAWPAATDIHTVTICPALEPEPTGFHIITATVTGWATWPGPEPEMNVHIWCTWLCPKTMAIGLRPSQHLIGFPNIYLGFLQPLFLNLQVWFESEGILPLRPASYSVPSSNFPPMPPTEEEISQILSQFPMATPTVWPSPEPVATGVHVITVGVDTMTVCVGTDQDICPAPKPEPAGLHTITVTVTGWSEPVFDKLTPTPESVAPDTHTVTIAIMRAGPFNGWLVVGDTITVTLPGPKPESEMFYAMTPGPEPVIVIHTLSVWTATERAKLGMNQSWGLEMYPRIPHRPTAAELPPMPPSDEFVSQLLATTPSMPLSESAPTWGQTITDTASNGWSSITYGP
jgi:hypothetical protein